jgi:SAM-dependent methyltransferase
MTDHLSGYATDIPYLRDFKPMLAPAWLDHVALVAAIQPPDRHHGFAWCDLGCGQGVTAALLAATHPMGEFHGIDAMPMHIDHARGLAAAAEIPNVRFHAVDFTAAMDLKLPPFDYIVAHGVFTWVDEEAQRALLRFIDRRLKPGGLVYLGYNAMPGWTRDLPFQRLVREIGLTSPGDSAARIAAAIDVARALAEAGVPALAASFTIAELADRPQDYLPGYLVHEFMPAAWRPLYVTEVRQTMRSTGLEPVGSATLSENFDWMVLNQRAREILSAIADDDTREIARDFFLDQRFRCDVFARGNRRLDPEERAGRLLSSTYALARPSPAIRYMAATAAGDLSYDNPATRRIVAALASVPGSLHRAIVEGQQAEGLKALLTLCAFGDVMPVKRGLTEIGRLNRILAGRVEGAEEICWLALPCGTAIEVDRGLMLLLRGGGRIDETQFPGWHEFLGAHRVL